MSHLFSLLLPPIRGAVTEGFRCGHKRVRRHAVSTAGLVLLFAALLPVAAQTPTATNADLLRGSGMFEKSYTATNPWGGVDSGEYLRGFQATAPIVMSNGQVDQVSIPTSVSVADMNGDKLPDLVVADPAGIIWFFPNGGTATGPKFTSGEVIPLWFPGFLQENDIISCNKINVVDFNDDGKPDLVIGTFLGEVYFVPNLGSGSAPRFGTNIKDCLVPTRSDNKLWGNFLAPCYSDFTKSNRRDLILGEGTYSANSIYFYPNAGTNGQPRFSEKTRQVLIRGMGREHLTPQIVDWNNDGMLDVITGERDGSVTVFLCKSNDPKKFEFDPTPIPVKFGSSSKLGSLSNPVPADMNGDGLFDIVVGRTNGRMAVAINKGKPGAPLFDATPTEFKGTQIYPKYLAPTGWSLNAPPESTFHLFRLVTGQDPEKATGAEKDRIKLGYEAGFTPPSDSAGKYAAKLEFITPQNRIFSGNIPILPESMFSVRCDSTFAAKPDVTYEIAFYTKGTGWQSAEVSVNGGYRITITDPRSGEKRYKWLGVGLRDSLSLGGGWSRTTKTFKYSKAKDATDKEKKEPVSVSVAFILKGKGTFYVDDVTVTEKK